MEHAAWLVDPANIEALERYLIDAALVTRRDLPIDLSRAGDGNMNLVLRIATRAGRTFILKQGRPWVEKYPQIAAPAERTIVEAAFYDAVRGTPSVAARMPSVLHVDRDASIVALEDVGRGADFTGMYAGAALPAVIIAALLAWLAELASVTVPSADARALFANRSMRALNHEHIFVLPLRPTNGLQLDAITPGLSEAAGELACEREYTDAVAALGRRYCADGETLVHGDFFPGSWLKDEESVRIIDPEFCFRGCPEFDLGVMAAHLALAASAPAGLEMIAASATARQLDMALVAGYAGVEIMRRLIGVAQLPINGGIETKRALLERSRSLVLEPSKGLA